ncbi:DNA repair protein RadC [Bacteroides sp. 519]|uniref:RadC family protein n=1 Tax=Bacteroides sp. 519 TaxID=2302937 RepID=UPI0013D203B3|nr:DNA repair protein RadC [Bacteroides sp. 519]NDV57252.1 JAB domain-containing protein [Bacteroides sp. 519]
MQNTEKPRLSINKWAEEDRPREKMLSKGINALSDAELLAILIGSGNKDESAVELMRRMLSTCDNNLNELGKWNSADFSVFNGIGPAKATTIMAALELGKRRKLQEAKERSVILSSRDAYNIFHPILCDAPQEEFWILLLNQASKVIKTVKISTGGIDGTYADVRTILREALLERATSIILCHNHPSGNPEPSINDKRLTSAIQQAAKTMNINLVDHIVVCDGTYFSFGDKGLI